ncbi:putative sulfate transporter YvdB [Nymphon striatum]|nr:putative sulfate transporter YvdB [Nymphon striatum]
MMLKKYIILFSVLFITLVTKAQDDKNAVTFEMRVSKEKLGINERLRVDFTMNKDGDNFTPPDFTGFRVLMGPSQSISSSWVNGVRSYSKTYSYTLAPTARGNFNIKQATIIIEGKTYKSLAKKIEVSAAVDRPNGQKTVDDVADESLHLVAEVSKTNPYLNEALSVVYKLYVSPSISVSNYRPLDNPTYNNFWSQDIPVSNRNAQNGTYKGKTYRYVILKRVILYPQKSGKLEIEPLSLDVTVDVPTNKRDFFGGRIYSQTNKTVSAGKRTINVKELPSEGKPADFGGAVGDFDFSITTSKTSLNASESLQARVEVNGKGNLKLFQLPEPNLPASLEVYEPEFDEKIRTTLSGMQGKVSNNYTIVPSFKGKYPIPSISFSYFDPKAKTYRTLSSEEIVIDVIQGPANSSASNSNTNSSNKQSAILFGKKRDALARDVSGNKIRKANKLARKYLSTSKKALGNKEAFYVALEKGLHNYLKAKLKIETSEFSKDKIAILFDEKKVDETTKDGFMSLLKNCEMARYSPFSDVQMQQDYDKASEAQNDALFSKATDAYNSADYNKAIESYLAIIETGQHSSELYFNLEYATQKRITFITSLLSLVLAVVSTVFAFLQYSDFQADNPAIVFDNEIKVTSEPNKKSQAVFTLHEGTKVYVLEELKGYKKIRIADGQTGWLNSESIKAILAPSVITLSSLGEKTAITIDFNEEEKKEEKKEAKEKDFFLSSNFLLVSEVTSIVVFFVALPLCLGIALASGAPLFSGLIAGIIGGVIVGALSGSQIGVSGPAAGLAAIVLTAITALGGFENFLLAVVLGGVIQLALGFLKAGIIGYYFPSSVIKGMLTGIEGDFAFLQVDGENTFSELANAVNFISPGATLIAVIALAILLLWSNVLSKKGKIFQLVQGPLVAVAVGILYYIFTQDTDFAISQEHLVSVPVPDSVDSFLGQFAFPNFGAITRADIWLTAFTIALVASLETLLCVEATDKLDPAKRVTPTNRELLAQGTGNIISGMIGGLPITQVIVRSSANIQSGGKSKISAIIHGFFLLISVILIPNLLNKIPLSVLASILLIVGYKLAKPSTFKAMWNAGWKQFVPFIVTVVGIFFIDLLWEDQSNGKHRIKMTFAEEVTFFNKGAILKELDSLPRDTYLEIDVRKTRYLDNDIIEILDDFAFKAKERNIDIKLISERGVIENPESFIQFFKLRPKSA